jgi:DNA-binding NtrC family response regulator
VGKELIARGLAQTRGANLPFIAFNCGDVDPHLVGDALFGHVKGAFTGATADTPGRFEAAGKGTIFIDELGELPKDQQARLLRVIQNMAIQRRGANEETPIHCRIVLATHRNLEQQVTGGAFREDLFYRVTPLQIWVPPLRDRLADLPELALTILARLSSDGEAKILSPGAMQRLGEHHWPGNVRELENVLTRAAVKRHGMEIPAEDLEFGFGPPGAMAAKHEAQTLARTLERQRLAERVLLQKALDDAGGNVREAARTLGKSNTSLRRRMRQLGMLTTPEALLE